MSKIKRISTLKFKISFDRTQCFSRLQSAISETSLKNMLKEWGPILAYASNYLEDLGAFAVYDDGSLRIARDLRADQTVEIDFFDMRLGLRAIAELRRKVPARSERLVPETLDQGRKLLLQGSAAGQPELIHKIGLDKNGLFLVDRRARWIALHPPRKARKISERPLPD